MINNQHINYILVKNQKNFLDSLLNRVLRIIIFFRKKVMTIILIYTTTILWQEFPIEIVEVWVIEILEVVKSLN